MAELQQPLPGPLKDAANALLGHALPVGANRVFVFGNGDDDAEYLKTCSLLPYDVDACDFILARGMFCTLGKEEKALTLESDECCDAVLRVAAERGLPM